MNINFIIVLLYLLIYLKFGILLLFIPFSVIFFFFPANIKFIFAIKNIVASSLSFIIKSFMGINVNVNSLKLFNELTSNSKGKNIIISNHLTELDPTLITLIFNDIDYFYSKINYLSKKLIGFLVPSVGILGIYTGDIYLDRQINLDKNKLSIKVNSNYLMLYPEGTCFTKEKKFKSDEYCKKNKLPIFKYHLYPRVSGLKLILENNTDVHWIYDLTFVYDTISKKKYGPCYEFLSFISKYKFPKKIFIKIKKYRINKNDNINKKIENIYIEKDEFINNFDINNNDFIPIKYDHYKGLIKFIIISIFSLSSIYLFYKYKFYKYLCLSEMIYFYIYFYFYG